MRISSKSRYAILSMLELAIRKEGEPIKLAEIADKHSLSISYLEQLFAHLRLQKLVKGRRGPGGGYLLNKDCGEISIAEIIKAVDEWVAYSQSKLRDAQRNYHPSEIRQMWDDLSIMIYDYLDGISLLDLVEQNKKDLVSLNKESFLDQAA